MTHVLLKVKDQRLVLHVCLFPYSSCLSGFANVCILIGGNVERAYQRQKI